MGVRARYRGRSHRGVRRPGRTWRRQDLAGPLHAASPTEPVLARNRTNSRQHGWSGSRRAKRWSGRPSNAGRATHSMSTDASNDAGIAKKTSSSASRTRLSSRASWPGSVSSGPTLTSWTTRNRALSGADLAPATPLSCTFARSSTRRDSNRTTTTPTKRSPERRQRPDFLFPNVAAYRDPTFPESRLRMLGVKTSLRDRWRQVLAEADRIKVKHLLTLDTVTEAQLQEIEQAGIRLVVPRPLHRRSKPPVRPHLQTLESFMADVRLLSA